MTETLLICLILGLSVAYILFRIRKFLLTYDSAKSPCDSCAGCSKHCSDASECTESKTTNKKELYQIGFFLILSCLLFSGCQDDKFVPDPYFDPEIDGKPNVGIETTNFLILDDKNFDQFALRGLVFIDFWSPGCPPCLAMEPALEKIAEYYKNEFKDQILFTKVNVDSNPKLSNRYNVRAYPYFVILNNGSLVFEHLGALPEKELRTKIELVLIANEAASITPSGNIIVPGRDGGAELVPINEVNPDDFVLPGDEDGRPMDESEKIEG